MSNSVEQVYRRVARKVSTYCWKGAHPEHRMLAAEQANELVLYNMPIGTTINWERCSPNRLVFNAILVRGSGDCVNHCVSVRASLQHGIVLHITGKVTAEEKDAIYVVFREALTNYLV